MAAVDPGTALPPAPPPIQGLSPDQQQQLSRNPMLPQTPMGAYTDAQYEQEMASLKAATQGQYAALLQQLGMTDENGDFIPGSVEVGANRQQTELQRQMGLADDETTKQAQQQGTLFSGVRGTQQARAEYPFANSLAQLATDTPTQLQSLFDQVGQLMGNYTTQQQAALAAAAARRSASLTTDPGAGPAAGGGLGVGGAAPAVSSPPAGAIDSSMLGGGPSSVAPPTPAAAGTISGGGQILMPTVQPPSSVPSQGPGSVSNTYTTRPNAGVIGQYTDPHAAITDVHKATVNAITKLNQGMGGPQGI